jgi:hypothetical protein
MFCCNVRVYDSCRMNEVCYTFMVVLLTRTPRNSKEWVGCSRAESARIEVNMLKKVGENI